MKLLVCYKKIFNIPKAVYETLCENGSDCVFMQMVKSEEMCSFIRKNGINAVLSSESEVLTKCNVDGVGRIYVSADYHCTQKLEKTDCGLYIIPSKESVFEFINSGARDKKVEECGLPLRRKFRNVTDKNTAREKFGIADDMPVFSVFASEATKSEVKSTVRSILRLCKEAQVLLAVNSEAEKVVYCSLFSDYGNVFVHEVSDDEALYISAADVVFTVANAEMLTAVSRSNIPLMIMKSINKRYKGNREFFDKRGIGFEGKTPADNASYAGRILKSNRLRDNMISAQNKFIKENSEKEFFEKISSFLEKLV